MYDVSIMLVIMLKFNNVFSVVPFAVQPVVSPLCCVFNIIPTLLCVKYCPHFAVCLILHSDHQSERTSCYLAVPFALQPVVPPLCCVSNIAF